MFTLKIKTDGAAMSESLYCEHELGRILKVVAEDVYNGCKGNVIHDINGNKVGEWKWTKR